MRIATVPSRRGKIAGLIIAYRQGATGCLPCRCHGLSLVRLKRLLHIAGVRQSSSTRRAKATPAIRVNRVIAVDNRHG
jgi:hypothetical protein